MALQLVAEKQIWKKKNASKLDYFPHVQVKGKQAQTNSR